MVSRFRLLGVVVLAMFAAVLLAHEPVRGKTPRQLPPKLAQLAESPVFNVKAEEGWCCFLCGLCNSYSEFFCFQCKSDIEFVWNGPCDFIDYECNIKYCTAGCGCGTKTEAETTEKVISTISQK